MKIFHLFDKKPAQTSDFSEESWASDIDEGTIRVTIEEALDINEFESQEAKKLIAETLAEGALIAQELIRTDVKARGEWLKAHEKDFERLFRNLLKSAKMENKAVLYQVVKEAFSEMLVHYNVSRIPEDEVF
mgnify:CR=1 FL=1